MSNKDITITLLSDFGNHEYASAILKGVFMKHLPGADLVDVSHNLQPFQLLQCAYFLKSTIPFFSKDTIHLVLMELLQKNNTSVLLGVHKNGYIITGDNGILSLAFGEYLEEVYQIASQTDDYVDWFDKVASFIKTWSEQGFSTENLTAIEPKQHVHLFDPQEINDALICQVIHVDKFGNVVLNLDSKVFEQYCRGRNFRISFSRNEEITRISKHYSDVNEGEKLCLFNSGGFLEIAINKGHAADIFGLNVFKPEQLIYNEIRIEFF